MFFDNRSSRLRELIDAASGEVMAKAPGPLASSGGVVRSTVAAIEALALEAAQRRVRPVFENRSKTGPQTQAPGRPEHGVISTAERRWPH